MRTLTSSALRALVVCGALTSSAPAAAIETLVESNGTPDVPSSLKRAATDDPVIDDITSFPHYTGTVNTAAALRNRAFTLTLPETGETLTLEHLEVAEIEGGYTLTSASGTDGPVVEIVIIGTEVFGTVRIGAEDLYVITPLGDGTTAVHRQDVNEGTSHDHHTHDHEVVTAKTLGIETSATGHTGASAKAARTAKNAPGPAVIDILFLYNQLAEDVSGGIEARLNLTILKMNEMFERSLTTTRVRLAGSHRVDYPAQANIPEYSRALGRMTNPEDGHLDEIFAIRERVGADVVALFIGATNTNLCGGGVGPVLQYDNIDHPRVRASFTRRAMLVSQMGVPRCVEGTAETVAHELAHLIGGLHNPEQYPDNLQAVRERYYPYGFGYCDHENDFRTILSYRQNSGHTCFHATYSFSNSNVRFRNATTGTAHLHNMARLIDENAPHVASFLAEREPEPAPLRTWHLPLVPQANGGALQGFVRIHNLTTERAEIALYGYDETGRRSGPLEMTLPAGRARGLNAYHLEGKTPHAALDDSLHDGEGHWRLVVRSRTALEVRAYTRTPTSGFASEVHQRAPFIAGSAPRAYRVTFLNPGANRGSRGLLRITNPGSEPNTVTLRAWDDLGQPGEQEVSVDIEPRATVSLFAQDLEEGNADRFTGRFGDGTGKWRVRVESADSRALLVLALVATRDGAVHNVSR